MARPRDHSGHNKHPRKCEHYLQFYDAEDHLYGAIAKFVLPSFFSIEHASIIVATRTHLDALEARLRDQNLVPALLKERRQLVLIDANSLLESLMPGGQLDAQRFDSFFGPLFHEIQERYPRILVYGELVNILCERNQHQDAHNLERVWDRFLAGRNVALLCGYDMNVFKADGLDSVFQDICRSHSHISPTESWFSDLKFPEDQSIVVAMLQQKAKCLEAQISRRKASETALEIALEHLSLVPTERDHALRERDDPGSSGTPSYPPPAASMPVGICGVTTCDSETEYFINPRFADISGLQESEIRRDGGWLNAVHFQDKERVIENLSNADKTLRKIEYRFVQAGGKIRWVAGETIARSRGYIHTVVDITDSKKEKYQRQEMQTSQNYGHDTPFDPSSAIALVPHINQPNPEVSFRRVGEHPGFTMELQEEFIYTDGFHLTSNQRGAYLRTEFAKIGTMMGSIAKEDSYVLNPINCTAIQVQLDKLHSWYEHLPDFLLLGKINFDWPDQQDHTDQRTTVLLAHCAYLDSILILTRRVFVKVAIGPNSSGITVDIKSAEVGFANICVSAARELCRVIKLLTEATKHGTGWLAVHASFSACMVVFLNLSLRHQSTDRQPPPLIAATAAADNDDGDAKITVEGITKCFELLMGGACSGIVSVQDPVARRYLEILNPFRKALIPPSTPPPRNTALSAVSQQRVRGIAARQVRPEEYEQHNNPLRNLHNNYNRHVNISGRLGPPSSPSSNQQPHNIGGGSGGGGGGSNNYAITNEILQVIQQPSGGATYDAWAARRWNWEFLLPTPPSQPKASPPRQTPTLIAPRPPTPVHPRPQALDSDHRGAGPSPQPPGGCGSGSGCYKSPRKRARREGDQQQHQQPQQMTVDDSRRSDFLSRIT